VKFLVPFGSSAAIHCQPSMRYGELWLCLRFVRVDQHEFFERAFHGAPLGE
jgi:hypothetical protein